MIFGMIFLIFFLTLKDDLCSSFQVKGVKGYATLSIKVLLHAICSLRISYASSRPFQ